MRGGRNGGTGGPPLPPPRRGDAMVAAPSRAWHVFKPILPDPWDPFRPAPPRAPPSSSAGRVAPMVAGGHADTRGDVAARGVPWPPGNGR